MTLTSIINQKYSPNHPQLIFNGTLVVKADEQKHLRLSFEEHLNAEIIKAKKNIGILKHLSKLFLLNKFSQMYKALVRYHLDYCDIMSFHVWL